MAFFIEIPNFRAWADKFWGIWGIFGRTISTHFGRVSPLSMFSIIQPSFLQRTKPLYPLIIRMGFEFGPQVKGVILSVSIVREQDELISQGENCIRKQLLIIQSYYHITSHF